MKLFRPMSPEEIRFIKGFKVGEKYMRAGTDVVEAGTSTHHVYTLYSGWALRYDTLPDGRKQILSILLPGDMIGLQAAMFDEAQHSVQALTDVTLCVFLRDRFFELYRRQPKLGYDVTWLAAHSEAIVDANLLSVGRRTAIERMAYLILSLHDRLDQLGLVTEGGMRFPLTQQQIGDALGLSIVHTNKTLKKLYQRQAIVIRDRHLTILDRPALERIARYDENAHAPRPLL